MLEEAQRELSNLVNAILSDDRIRSEFNLFDASVSQKLWSTKYYCNELLRLEVHSPSVSPSLSYTESITATTLVTPLIDYVIKPFENYTYSTESPTSTALPEDILDYYRHLNRLLDGFFMNAMSALDTIAHQISTLYVLEKIYEDKDIYIGLVA